MTSGHGWHASRKYVARKQVVVPDIHRILIVDDATNARAALAALVRDEGFVVETAANGREALGKLTKFAPHVVITDLELVGMDAIELATRLLQVTDPPSVIVMTAFGENRLAVEALRAGAEDYVTKPINFDELLIVLNKTIKHHDLEREVQTLRALARG